MLLKAYSLSKTLAAIALLCTTLGATAQDAPVPPTDGFDSPYLDSTKINPEELAKAKAAGAAMVRDILSSYETTRTPEMEVNAQQIRKKFDDIADAAIADERNKILDFLGIDPAADSGLYYFVSWSMPMELLRSYVVEAMWSGATIVFKGVPPGKELGKFVIDDLRQLVYGKGAAANLSIDPRLYDAYAVKTVPTIVFTTVRTNMQCQGVNPIPVKVGEVLASYDTCPELDPSTYWKISGGVTTNYALETFIADGAVAAKPYLRALAKGFQTGEAPPKNQVNFAGKWEDAITPSELLAAQEAAGLMTTPAKAP
jgi:type-F conjugative transfer system pilin assembly protein TrbC